MIGQSQDKHLLSLQDCTQKYELFRDQIKACPRYFFDIRSKTLLIHSQSNIYILSGEQTKMANIQGRKKQSIIFHQLSYNPLKNILIYLNNDNQLIANFISQKKSILIKPQFKKDWIFGWIFNNTILDFFIGQGSGIKLYKIDDDKKIFKEIKVITNKYNSYLYQPCMQVLVGFPGGDCKTVHCFLFDDENRYKKYFKGPEIGICYDIDQNLVNYVNKNKSLGLKSSKIYCQLFRKQPSQQFYAQLLPISGKCYLAFYFGKQHQLRIYCVSQQLQKQIIIHLPSVSSPSLAVVDGMLVVNTKKQNYTFTYDINYPKSQIFYPFQIKHKTKNIKPYEGVFVGNRHVMPDGCISRWSVNISAIFPYIKNQVQIFDFLFQRQKAKPQLLKWLRQHLLKIKRQNLSKFWKKIFSRTTLNFIKDNEGISEITIEDLHNQIFQSLYMNQSTSKQQLLNIVLQCVRQAKQSLKKLPLNIQKLLFNLLLQCKKYQMLVLLIHFDLIQDNQQHVAYLISKGINNNQQTLITLAIDMAHRVCKPNKILQLLIITQRIWQAKRYFKYNFQHLQLQPIELSSQSIVDEQLKNEYTKFTKQFIHKQKRLLDTTTSKYLIINSTENNQKDKSSPRKNYTSQDIYITNDKSKQIPISPQKNKQENSIDS